jgi:hypothetical protein
VIDNPSRPPLPEEYEGLMVIAFVICGASGAIVGALITSLLWWWLG